jgi:hypothetical protein
VGNDRAHHGSRHRGAGDPTCCYGTACIASRVKGELDVVHVVAGDTGPPADGGSIGGLRSLTADLGARWHEIEDDDPARALVSFAHGPGAGRTKPAAMTSFSSAPAA